MANEKGQVLSVVKIKIAWGKYSGLAKYDFDWYRLTLDISDFSLPDLLKPYDLLNDAISYLHFKYKTANWFSYENQSACPFSDMKF